MGLWLGLRPCNSMARDGVVTIKSPAPEKELCYENLLGVVVILSNQKYYLSRISNASHQVKMDE